jgi:hypothetical protein
MDTCRVALAQVFDRLMHSWIFHDGGYLKLLSSSSSSASSSPPSPSSSSSSSSLSSLVEPLTVDNVESVLNDDTCLICRDEHEGGVLLICDGCDGKHHMSCVRPVIHNVPSGSWFCQRCTSVPFVDERNLLNKQVNVTQNNTHNNISSDRCGAQGNFANKYSKHRTFGLFPRLDPRICSASALAIIEESGVIVSQLQSLQILAMDCERWGQKDWLIVLDTLTELVSSSPPIESR